MTKDEMRREVAEALGWRISYALCDNGKYLCDPKNKLAMSVSFVPEYTDDLNACREMESELQPGERSHYQHALDKVCATSKDPHCSCWDFIHATAAQRCEAFLRVKGLWKD